MSQIKETTLLVGKYAKTHKREPRPLPGPSRKLYDAKMRNKTRIFLHG